MTKKKPPDLTPAQRLQPAWVLLAVELHAFAIQPDPRALSGVPAPIQFWMTPNAASIPLSQKDGALQPHFADCPKAASFKRPR